MQQEDWLIRQINQLGRVLGKILADLLGLKDHGQVVEGIETAAQALKNELDLNIDDLIAIPIEQFIKTMQESKKFNKENLDNLADIFYLIAEELEQQGTDNQKVRKLYERSLSIYQYLDNAGSTFSFDRHYKIDKIKSLIQSQ